MLHKKIRIPKYKILPILHELGKLEDIFEFIDLNKADLENKKNYSGMVDRCDNIDRRITKFIGICEKFGIKNNLFEDFEDYKLYSNHFDNKVNILNKLPFDCIEQEVNADEKQLEEFYSNYTSIEEYLDTLYEKKEVWLKIKQLVMNKDTNNANMAKR